MNTPDQGRPARPRWTLSEAARRTGVSRATLLRRIESGKIIGAQKTTEGWSIGIEDLLGAGLVPDRLARSSKGVREHVHEHVPVSIDTGQAVHRIAELERELAVAHAQRAAAEQVAAERERIIQAQAQTLRMLEAAPRSADLDDGSGVEILSTHKPPESAALPIVDGPIRWLRRRLSG